MQSRIFPLFLCLMLSLSAAYGATLARNGHTAYRIYVPEQAAETTKNAARELSDFLKRVTGAEFRISAVPGNPSSAIAVGPEAAKKLDPALDLSLASLGGDGILLDVRPGGTVILTGAEGASRGTLNAVYTFLEDSIGCRWWTPDAMKIPNRPHLEIPVFQRRYIPPFSWREVGDPIAREGFYAVRNRLNGFFTRRPPGKWGDKIVYGDGNHLEFCHTFYHHVPPKKYFRSHPEWYAYSQSAKKRIATDGNGIPGQLCLSSPGLLEFYKKQVRSLLARSPKETIVSVSQMDNCGPCQCAACLAIDAEEGAPSGKLIRFVNAIADDIRDDFPHARIDTLAYTHNRKAPKTAPRSNVIVRLCSIECSYSHPFSHPENADFLRDLKAWQALGTNLHVWDYSVNFANYLMPHPGLRVLGENMRILASHGVTGVLMLGCHSSRNGEFSALRSWVTAKLLWDPSRDCAALIREFCMNYYGAAGKKILDYIAWMEKNLDESGEKLTVFNSATHTGFTRPEVLSHAEKLFADALRAVDGDPLLTGRVRQAEMPLLFAIVNNYAGYAAYRKKQNLPLPERSVFFAKMEAVNREFPVGQVREGVDFAGWLQENRNFIRKQTFAPECLRGKQDYREIQDDKFSLGKTVPDPLASDGGAVFMRASKKANWLIQLNQFPVKPGDGAFQIYAEVRAKFTKPGKKMTAFQWGLYDPRKKTSILLRKISVPEEKNNRYELYYLGENKFRDGQYLWFSQTPDADIFVDRVILVRR